MNTYKPKSPRAANPYGTPRGIVRIWIGPGQGFEPLRAANSKAVAS
jgi:hypothetical protein